MRSILTTLLVLFTVSLHAQKLPNVQQVSLRAPGNVKIDGKATEWGQMKAYNKTTEINYTIANDDKKLYLIVQTDGVSVYNRISNTGIKLVVQKNGRKSDKGAAFMKYPFFNDYRNFSFVFNKATRSGIIFPNGTLDLTEHPVKKITSKEQADSVMQSHNAILREKLKFIYTDGLPGIDNLVSIYNDKGVDAAVAFDNKKIYTCEMAIDLKLLGLTAQSGEKFAYHIVINGEPYRFNPDGASPEQRATTDFWAEYTLAK